MPRTGRYNLREVVELVQEDGSEVDVSSESSDDDDWPSEDEYQLDNDQQSRSESSQSQADSLIDTDSQPQSDGYAEWSEKFTNFPIVHPFSGDPGIKANLPDEVSALDVFQLFFTEDLLRIVKTETNRYATLCIRQKAREGGIRANSVFALWKPCRLDDLRRFFAVIFHMCLVKKPQMKDYWSQNSVLHSTFAARMMTRDRFLAILTFFHISNNSNDDGSDRLFKIRPMLDVLVPQFKNNYQPEKKIAVDESICPFKGRIKFRVYIPNKPHKWGIKIYALCESQSGYMWNFEVFAADPNISNSPTDIVLRLTEPLRHQGYIVYTDNFYTCPVLSDALYAEDIMSVGVVRRNRREMPPEFKEKSLRKGETRFRRRGNLMALHWKDKRDVAVLSTVHSPEMCIVQSKTGHKQKPVAVQDYTLNMAGVDKSDQLQGYNAFRRKTLKWWKKLFFHLLTVCAVNATVIMSKHVEARGEKRWTLHKFFKTLAQDWADSCASDDRGNFAASPNTGASRLSGRHFPTRIPPTDKKQHPTRQCVVCSAQSRKAGNGSSRQNRHRKESTYWCSKCGKTLHPAPCFELYHTKVRYDE